MVVRPESDIPYLVQVETAEWSEMNSATSTIMLLRFILTNSATSTRLKVLDYTFSYIPMYGSIISHAQFHEAVVRDELQVPIAG
jgi:hypothetical protein